MPSYKGRIEHIFDEIEIGGSFKKREVAIREDAPQYPQARLFCLTKEKCKVLDNFKVGDKVEIDYNMNGFKKDMSDGSVRYFNSDEIWKINKVL